MLLHPSWISESSTPSGVSSDRSFPFPFPLQPLESIFTIRHPATMLDMTTKKLKKLIFVLQGNQCCWNESRVLRPAFLWFNGGHVHSLRCPKFFGWIPLCGWRPNMQCKLAILFEHNSLSAWQSHDWRDTWEVSYIELFLYLELIFV